ncbi:MAG: transglycosylase domain-containing protein [Nocardioides sp.]
MSRLPEELPTTSRVLSHLSVMALVAVVLGLITAGLAIPFVGALGLGSKKVAASMREFPEALETPPLAEKTVILDSAGKQIASIFDQNRVNVTLDKVSRTMVSAIVAIEDYRFYEHGAIDLKGTLRALLKNKAADGEVVQGGSSITQQTVKLTLIALAGKDKAKYRAATEDSYERKIRELRYSIAMEDEHSKDWILERYLNTAYFGDGAYGIQAAARNYFSVNASKLNLTQSATLAGLVKSPFEYDPTRNPDKAIGRRNVVLDRMAELKVITPAERDEAKGKDLGLNRDKPRNGCLDSPAAFFCDYVLAYLTEDKAFGATRAERAQTLKSGGLTIRTTLDSGMQAAADRSVRSHVFPSDQAIGGLAMVEPGTGAVRALSQSRPMGRDKKKGQTFLNYLVPSQYGDSRGFQAGSTFKAFTVAAALDQGVPITTQFNSPQQVSIPQTQFEVCNNKRYSNPDTWDPQNSTGVGTFDLYTGTRQSVNTFFAQLELTTGICAPYKLAQAMGLSLSASDRLRELTPSFTLGTVDVSPLEMAEAYATFAARGKHCASVPVTRVEDASGKVFGSYQPRCSQVFPEAVGDGVNAILRGVQEGNGFGALRGLALTRPSAGKTGTTQDSKAVWFVGYTPKLAAAAMIAGANSEGQPIGLDGQSVAGRTVYGASGSSFAGPIWGDAMKAIQDRLDPVDFQTPDFSGIQGRFARVPSVQGMSVGTAIAVLNRSGFKAAIGPAVNGGGPVGAIANSFPGGQSSAPYGSAVLISPSTGQQGPRPCKDRKRRRCEPDGDDRSPRRGP